MRSRTPRNYTVLITTPNGRVSAPIGFYTHLKPAKKAKRDFNRLSRRGVIATVIPYQRHLKFGSNNPKPAQP